MLGVRDRTQGCPKPERMTSRYLSGTSVAIDHSLAPAAALIRREHVHWRASS